MPPGYVIKKPEDWLQDLDAIAIPFPDIDLATAHSLLNSCKPGLQKL